MALNNNSPVQRAPSVSDSPPTPAITPIAAPASSQPPAIPGAAVQPATPPAVPDLESENRHDPKAFLRDPMMSCARLKSWSSNNDNTMTKLCSRLHHLSFR